jgi:hypothetical protein
MMPRSHHICKAMACLLVMLIQRERRFRGGPSIEEAHRATLARDGQLHADAPSIHNDTTRVAIRATIC